jgi:hypothetical protein
MTVVGRLKLYDYLTFGAVVCHFLGHPLCHIVISGTIAYHLPLAMYVGIVCLQSLSAQIRSRGTWKADLPIIRQFWLAMFWRKLPDYHIS